MWKDLAAPKIASEDRNQAAGEILRPTS